MDTNTGSAGSSSSTNIAVDPSTLSDLTPIAVAARGKEITGLEIFQNTTDDITAARAEELASDMNADQPTGGMDMEYGNEDAQRLRFWKTTSSKAPIVIFVHGGSWRSGTYLDSIGSVKVNHLTGKGYAFATVNYTLIPP
ncbi:Alpha/Beta hydrolase protein [Penicillium lividum]|nr:Alpha/Beta hydrolase protein [Penicillium lividum]